MLRLHQQTVRLCLPHRGFRSAAVLFQDNNEANIEADNSRDNITKTGDLANRLKMLSLLGDYTNPKPDQLNDDNANKPTDGNAPETVIVKSRTSTVSAKHLLHPPVVPKLHKYINPNQVYKPLKVPDQPEVPTLAHGLDRVLFNPGVHHLKDPRTQQYNFTSFLEYLTQPPEFNYDMLAPYISPSNDKNLTQLAKKHRKRYVGSTSSVSGALSQFYFALTNFKPVDMSALSMNFSNEPSQFTRATCAPTSINLIHNNGVYSVDADKSFDLEETILSVMGKSMEKVLTLEPEDFERYLKDSESPLSPEETNQPETYAYGTINNILLRSQLDCQDPRLPRKTFDLKTRAVVPVRLDIRNYQEYLGYSLRRSHGLFESFEREYYDMMRSAFLKYNFQVRIGHMDGILVAYHNTRKMFGFQYISREEMDVRLFGNSWMGNQAFNKILVLFQGVLDTVTKKYPKTSLRLTFEARKNQGLHIFAEALPVEGLASQKKPYGSFDTEGDDESMDGLLNEEKKDDVEEEANDEFFNTEDPETHGQLSKFVLHIESMVNDEAVTEGPVSVGRGEVWKTRYNIKDMHVSQDDARKELKAVQKRQMMAYGRNGSLSPGFANILRRMSKRGLLAEKRSKRSQKDGINDSDYLF